MDDLCGEDTINTSVLDATITFPPTQSDLYAEHSVCDVNGNNLTFKIYECLTLFKLVCIETSILKLRPKLKFYYFTHTRMYTRLFNMRVYINPYSYVHSQTHNVPCIHYHNTNSLTLLQIYET